MWSWDIILALLAVGSAAGFIAGLFGVGGGTLIVPVVLWTLQLQGIGGHPYAQHLAIGTSFAVMVFTTFSSMYAQHKKARHRLGDRPPDDAGHDTWCTPRRGVGKIYADTGLQVSLLHFLPLSHSKPYAIPNPNLHAPCLPSPA